jgi:2Fe-2S ferredoxin
MTFLPENRTVEIGTASSVLEVALNHDIALNHECGGMGSCTTCLIRIRAGGEHLPPRDEVEDEMATMKGFEPDERLACQIPPRAGLVIER